MLSKALNTGKVWSNGIKTAFFFQKIIKNRPTTGGFAPRPPKLLASGGPAPKPSSVIHLNYTSFISTFPKLDICIFQQLVKTLFLCKILVTCKQATTILDLPSYDIFVPQKLLLWKNFDDVISCDLWFRPPPTKKSGYANKLETAWKKIFNTFFFWRTLGPVSLVLGLGLEHSCPWPREFLSSERLSLASNVFVSLALASSLVSSSPPLVSKMIVSIVSTVQYNDERAVMWLSWSMKVLEILDLIMTFLTLVISHAWRQWIFWHIIVGFWFGTFFCY